MSMQCKVKTVTIQSIWVQVDGDLYETVWTQLQTRPTEFPVLETSYSCKFTLADQLLLVQMESQAHFLLDCLTRTESKRGQPLHYLGAAIERLNCFAPPGKPNLTFPHKDMPHTGHLSERDAVTSGVTSPRPADDPPPPTPPSPQRVTMPLASKRSKHRSHQLNDIFFFFSEPCLILTGEV